MFNTKGVSCLPRLPRSAPCSPAPFPLHRIALQGWVIPSPCTCYARPSPGGVGHVRAAFKADVQKQMPTRRSYHEQQCSRTERADGEHSSLRNSILPAGRFSAGLVFSALQMGSSLNRARARGFTVVLRRGGPLLFRFLAKQSFRKRPRKLSSGALPKSVP